MKLSIRRKSKTKGMKGPKCCNECVYYERGYKNVKQCCEFPFVEKIDFWWGDGKEYKTHRAKGCPFD